MPARGGVVACVRRGVIKKIYLQIFRQTHCYFKKNYYLCSALEPQRQRCPRLTPTAPTDMAIFATLATAVLSTAATTATADALRTALAKGAVRFTFFKRDGSIREAYGTRNLSVASSVIGACIPAPYCRSNPNAFYDLEKCAWRSFIPENVCSIDS